MNCIFRISLHFLSFCILHTFIAPASRLSFMKYFHSSPIIHKTELLPFCFLLPPHTLYPLIYCLAHYITKMDPLAPYMLVLQGQSKLFFITVLRFLRAYLYATLMAPHSTTLAWKIPWIEEPGRLQSMGSLRVGHD